MKIISGTAHLELAGNIAATLGQSLADVQVDAFERIEVALLAFAASQKLPQALIGRCPQNVALADLAGLNGVQRAVR